MPRTLLIGCLAAALSVGAPVHAFMGRPNLAGAISLGSLTFTGVYPRIFTPNGDGANDKAGFHFDNPELLPVQGRIFDLSGSQVASLSSSNDELLLWDGKDGDGRPVPGGIYLYQIEFEGKHATGTLVVAR